MSDEALNGPIVGDLEPSDAPFTIEDVISEATPRTRSCHICVRGDLRDRFDELDAQLQERFENRRGEPSLAEGGGDLRALADQVEAARADIRRHLRKFVFQSIGPNWSAMVSKHSNEQGTIPDFAAYVRDVVAASAVRPTIPSPEKAQELFDRLSQGDIDLLFITARRANMETTAEVPKSQLASRIREGRSSETS